MEAPFVFAQVQPSTQLAKCNLVPTASCLEPSSLAAVMSVNGSFIIRSLDFGHLPTPSSGQNCMQARCWRRLTCPKKYKSKYFIEPIQLRSGFPVILYSFPIPLPRSPSKASEAGIIYMDRLLTSWGRQYNAFFTDRWLSRVCHR
jgi:hypothetical protein